MKRNNAVLAIVLLSLFAVPRSAPAQIPVTDVAHIAVSTYSEAMRYFQAAYEIVQQATAIYNQIRTIENQIVALKKLDYHSWRNIGPLYHQLNGLLRQAETLTYAMEDLESQFYATFPGATHYTNFPSEHFTEVQRTLDTMRLNLESLHQIHEDQRGSLQVLGYLETQAENAEGHEQSLEVLAELGSWQASQLATMGATLQSIANAQIVAASYQINQDARMRQTTIDALAATLNRAQADQAVQARTYTVVPSWMPQQ